MEPILIGAILRVQSAVCGNKGYAQYVGQMGETEPCIETKRQEKQN